MTLVAAAASFTVSPSIKNTLQFLPPKRASLDFPSKKQFSRRSSRILAPLGVAAPPSPPTSDQEQVNQDSVEAEENRKVGEELGEESEGSKFCWRDHWYPVSLVEDLDPRFPTPFQLLGRDLVLWFDKGSQQWVAFDDKCPHRLAPLSEGRIDENGHLQCSYHGWSFDGCGSCTRIPQASNEGPEARAVRSPRACATRFPTMVSHGLLFVWPDENGWERANATKPPM